MNACGVAVAMLRGHSWTPTLSNGWKVNVGTIPPVPLPASILLVDGKACCRLMPVGCGSSVFSAELIVNRGWWWG